MNTGLKFQRHFWEIQEEATNIMVGWLHINEFHIDSIDQILLAYCSVMKIKQKFCMV